MCSDARHLFVLFGRCDLAAIVMGCDCLVGDVRRWNIVNVDDFHLQVALIGARDRIELRITGLLLIIPLNLLRHVGKLLRCPRSTGCA